MDLDAIKKRVEDVWGPLADTTSFLYVLVREDIPALIERIADLEAENARLREALRPIGADELMAYLDALATKFGPIYDEDMMVTLELAPAYPTGLWFLTAGQIRAAHALLNPTPTPQEAPTQEAEKGEVRE